jgi:KUP system potassium uptake protein
VPITIEGGIFALICFGQKTKIKWLIVPAIIGGSALLAESLPQSPFLQR